MHVVCEFTSLRLLATASSREEKFLAVWKSENELGLGQLECHQTTPQHAMVRKCLSL